MSHPASLPQGHGSLAQSFTQTTTCGKLCWNQRSRKATHARVLPNLPLLRLLCRLTGCQLSVRFSSCIVCHWSVLPRDLVGQSCFCHSSLVPFHSTLAIATEFRSHTWSPIDLKRLTTVWDSILLSAWQLTPLWILRLQRRLLQL